MSIGEGGNTVTMMAMMSDFLENAGTMMWSKTIGIVDIARIQKLLE